MSPALRLAALVCVAAAWFAGLPRAVLGGDNGEFATLFAEGGVAHPSGYPVYTLYLRAMSWLPAASPAQGAALATALVGLLALAVVEGAARAWGASPRGALVAATLVGVSPLMWRLSTHAEVFALNALVAASVIALAAPEGRWKGLRRAAALGAVAGVGLGNHLTCALLAPIGVYGVWRASRESSWRAAPVAVASALPGLATYATLWWTARHAGDRLVWGACETMRGLLAHALREDYGVARLSAGHGGALPAEHLTALAGSLWSNALGVGLVFAAAGVASTRAWSTRRPEFAALLATWVMVGPAFVARFNIAPTGIGRQVIERFHLLPLVVMSVFVALGFDHLAQRLAVSPRAQSLVGAILLGAGVAIAWPAVRAEHGPYVERYLRDTLRAAPRDAVIFGTGDYRAFGFPYLQRALGMRRDVLVIDPRQLLFTHYRRRVERRLGRALPAPRGTSLSSGDVLQAALSTGRPVLLTDVFSRTITERFTTWPEGTLIHVVPTGAAPPPLREVVQRNEAWFRAAEQTPPGDPVDGWARAALSDYAAPWRTLAATVAGRGRPDIAAALAQRARAWEP